VAHRPPQPAAADEQQRNHPGGDAAEQKGLAAFDRDRRGSPRRRHAASAAGCIARDGRRSAAVGSIHWHSALLLGLFHRPGGRNGAVLLRRRPKRRFVVVRRSLDLLHGACHRDIGNSGAALRLRRSGLCSRRVGSGAWRHGHTAGRAKPRGIAVLCAASRAITGHLPPFRLFVCILPGIF
jgi:hypothetical protein